MNRNPNEYEIGGMVRGCDGVLLRRARVVVWWRHICDRRELAAGETSKHGRYPLRYRIPEDTPKPLLINVETLSEYLHSPLLSGVTAAQPILEIDLNFVPHDQSEWAVLARSIEQFLNGLTLAELTENTTHHDISFLSAELGKTIKVATRVALSARLEAAFKIPAPAFYSFLRQKVPATLPSSLLDASQNFKLIDALIQSVSSMIFGLSAEVQTQTLTPAVALDLIGSQFTQQIPELVTQLETPRATDLLNHPYLVGSATLG